MDCDDNMPVKRCFKCEHNLLDNLNIIYSSSMIILWNKFQIFMYEKLNFENAKIIVVPEFQISHMIASSNYLICLDCCGNVHLIALKLKNSAQTHIKGNFLPREQNILTCSGYETDCVLCLKSDSDTYVICLRRVDTEFKLRNKVVLTNKNDQLQHGKQEKCLLISHTIAERFLHSVKHVFNIKEKIKNESSMVIISFDKLTLYGCLFDPVMTEDEITLIKLYACPSEICNIEIINVEGMEILIGLKIGTMIKLSLIDITRKPEIIHLNTAIHKFIVFNDSLVYTDGLSMWKTKNTFTENIKFHQLSIRNVKDMIKSGDQIICTTFSNLIYVFPFDDERFYVKPESTDAYCSAETVLNNSQYLYRIIEEIEKNNVLVKKLSEEENYISALALSKRQDIMDTFINNEVIVYDSYEDAVNDNSELTLTEEIAKYFEPETFCFLIKISASTNQHTLRNVLSNLSGDLKIHITLSSDSIVLKTTSVQLQESLKRVNVLIPLQTKLNQLNINLKIATKIPAAYDEKQFIWTVLYRKNIILNSEHFIKTDHNVGDKILHKKKTAESLDHLILQTVIKQYGNLFKFKDNTSKSSLIKSDYSLYIKLPDDYKKNMENEEYCKKKLNIKISKFMLKQLNSEDFLKSKCSLDLKIGNEKVKIEIVNDGISNPLLMVSSGNIKLAYNLRNFFANMIYNDFIDYGSDKEFINHTFYTSVENLQKSIRSCMTKTSIHEELQTLMERFERNIIGSIPL